MRIRYFSFRMRAAATHHERSWARLDLLKIGRPAIDDVFPELVAGELGDSVAQICSFPWVVFVGHIQDPSEGLVTPATQVDVFVVDEPIPNEALEDLHIRKGDHVPVHVPRRSRAPIDAALSGDGKPGKSVLVLGQVPELWTHGMYLYHVMTVELPDEEPLRARVVRETRELVSEVSSRR